MPQTYNISETIDHLPLRPYTIMLFLICFATMLSDGYDLGVVGLAAPGIVGEFHMVRSAMAPVFSASLLGMLFGALGSGLLGDRFGRKRGILLACVVISFASFSCGLAGSFDQLLILRFFTGLGLGGLLPNVTALIAEYMPKKIRGAFTTFAFMGITFGGVLPGVISADVVGGNWHKLFYIGGLIPLVVLPIATVFLPESLKFLTLQADASVQIRKNLMRLNPSSNIPADTVFVLDETTVAPFSLASLFAGHLKLLTPLLWICFIAVMLVNFFVNSWLTLVLKNIGFSAKDAATTASLYYAGGVCGGLIIGPALDAIGPIVLVLYCLLGGVITTLIGVPGTSAGTIHILVFIVGFSILGAQVGMSATAGMLYPTAVRSKGAGFAHAIGRFGAIGGPLLAGQLIAAHASLFTLFVVPAIPLVVAALSFASITWAWTGRPQGIGFAKLKAST
jgi:AAHS family 4-hydroxybenzoate transporter-like MFS transporter